MKVRSRSSSKQPSISCSCLCSDDVPESRPRWFLNDSEEEVSRLVSILVFLIRLIMEDSIEIFLMNDEKSMCDRLVISPTPIRREERPLSVTSKSVSQFFHFSHLFLWIYFANPIALSKVSPHSYFLSLVDDYFSSYRRIRRLSEPEAERPVKLYCLKVSVLKHRARDYSNVPFWSKNRLKRLTYVLLDHNTLTKIFSKKKKLD